MLIQSVQARTPEAPGGVSRVSGTVTGTAPRENTPADRVVVSEEGRALSAQLAAQDGPELQLSPERLRAMLEQATHAE